jgi:UDP-N-acetylmuramoyl-L-alanyl-D-glutamate--2,6-diaminopimelate ligase
MEGYYAAKRNLFTGLSPDAPAVLNADDPYGRRLAGECAGRPVLYGEAQGAAFRMIRCRTGVDGTVVEIEADGGTEEIRSPLVGRPNAYNLLAAAAASRSMGLGWEAIRSGAAAVHCVPGRLQRVEAGQPFTVVVDYAHTDDALRNVMEVLRPITAGRLIVVFGCGGDRDRSKRPLMGSHAARLADLFWITSDNPRREDPRAIIEMVLEGVRRVPGGDREGRVEPDREVAIRAAVARARPGDTVLIAGKGHETVQISGDDRIPFDDVEVARRAIAEHREAGPEEAGGESA